GGQSARVTTGPPRFITGTPTPATYTLALHDALPILLRELSARLPEPWRAARCQRHLVEGRPCEIGPAHGLLPHEAQPTACREETVGGRVRDCELVRDLAHRELAALAHELDDEECVLCRTHRGLLSVAG